MTAARGPWGCDVKKREGVVGLTGGVLAVIGGLVFATRGWEKLEVRVIVLKKGVVTATWG